RNEEVDELVPTRDGSWILVRTETPTEDERQTIVPDWVTDDGYTSTLTVRTKVGDEPDGVRIGVLETATGSVRWLRVTPEDYEGDGPPQVSNMGWNDAGTKAFLFAVSFDAKDRFLWSWDAESGEVTLLDHLHDDAWVAGPCFSTCAGFVPGTDRIYFVSEESGYAHLYAVNADGSDRRALTEGSWEVLDVEIPEDRSGFFLRTNEGSPFDEH